MKKLLIIMLVLGITSAVNAAILLDGPTTINKGDTVAIGINNTDGGDYLAYLSFGYVSEGGFVLSNPRYLYPDPPIIIPPFPPEPIGDYYEFEVTLAQPQGPSTPGIQFQVDLTCLKAGVDVFVDMWDAADLSAPADSMIIHQVPEPITLALLGLGGLFLLRRRK